MTTGLAARGLVAALALALAACSSGGASSSATSSPSATPASASPAATASTSASDGVLPSFDANGDPELAQRLRDALGGSGQVLSMRGDQFLGAGTDQTMKDFLTGVGAQPDDVSVAFGGTADGLSVTAMRILGTNETQLRDKFGTTAGSMMGGASEMNVGGKQVLSVANPAAGSQSVYVYFKDDTVYWMVGTQDKAAALLSKLP